jgi:hypothetical protein
MKWALRAAASLVLCLTSCETLSRVNLALDVLDGESSVQVQYGDGKAVLQAKQGDQRIRLVGQR